MAPLETLLEGDEKLDANRLCEVRSEYNTLKFPYDSNKNHVWILDAQITRREQLLNHETLMAGYTNSIANCKADELELDEKRDSLSTRLVQTQQQAEEDMEGPASRNRCRYRLCAGSGLGRHRGRK